MKQDEIFKAYSDCILPTYTKVPVIFTKGKGSKLWDLHSRQYLDFFPGWGVGNLGHCHPKVMQAVRDQIAKLIFIPNNYYHIPQAKLARELVYWTFPSKVFFCNSGAEAMEGAIKFSRKYGKGRYEIITFENSFHGRTLGALAATGQPKYQQGFDPLPPGFRTVPFNDIAAVSKAVTDKTVAVALELIQGEGGINVAREDFVLQLRQLCTERDMLLIIDEVQTGIGRTGKLFAFQHYGVTPDILTLAKALGGGLPIGAMVVGKDFAETLGPGMHASTFGGGPVVCRSALAVLQAVQREKLVTNAAAMGGYLAAGLKKLQERHPVVKDVRGKGLMLGMELAVPGKALVEECFARGLLINCTHDTVIRVMPALNVTRAEIDKALKIMENGLKKL